MCFNCLVHVLDYSGPVLGVTDLEALVGHTLHLFLQLDEVGCRRQYYAGGRTDFPGAAASVDMYSVTGTSVSMLAMRKG